MASRNHMRIFVASLLLLVFLIGCVSSTRQTAVVGPSSPGGSPIFTATALDGTTAAQTPTIMESAMRFDRRCIVSGPLSREDPIGPGTILFEESGALRATRGSLEEASEPPYSIGPTLHVASDGSMVAVTHVEGPTPHVVVMALDGRILTEFEWNPAYPAVPSYGLTWSTSDWLIIRLGGAAFYVWPSTGSARGTIQFPPDASEVFLNSALTREVVQDGYRTLSMIDPWSGDVIADLGTAALSLARPAWSPDGSLFAFTVESGDRNQYEDIYLVDDEAIGGQVTEFRDRFTDFDIRMLQWSPDGRYIAMWARTHPPSDVGLGERLDFFVFDVPSRTLLDFCLSRIFRYGVGNDFAAFWAPDSTSVIVPIFTDTPQLVIDISTGEAREIPVGISVWAWGP